MSVVKKDDFNKLVVRAKKKSAKAMEELYQQTNPIAYYTAFGILGNEQDALDIVQDSFVTVFSKLNELKDNSSFIPWLKQIVANRCKDMLKEKHPALFDSEEGTDISNPADGQSDNFIPDSYIEKMETRNQIMTIINNLSDVQRASILLFYYDGMSVRDISQVMGCTESTVTSRLAYAKKQIKKEVEKLEKQGDKLYAAAPIPSLTKLFMEDSKHHVLTESASKALFHNIITSSALSGGNAAGAVGFFAKMAGMSIGGKCAVAGACAAVVVGGTIAGTKAQNHSKDFSNFISSNENVEIVLAKPTSYQVSVKGTQNYEYWVQLDQLANYPDFRSDFDKLFHINKVTVDGKNGKSGCIYINKNGDRDGNTSFADAFRNKVFVQYFNSKFDSIGNLTPEVYSDANDSEAGVPASLNAYFGLLADANNPNAFNGSESLTREQFYYLMYKENHGVNKDFLKDYRDNNDPFVKATTGTEDSYSPFAKQTANYGFLQYKDGSLNSNIKSSISRIEAIYAVIQENFKQTYDKTDVKELQNSYDGFMDVKNDGDIVGDNTSEPKWEQYLLEYCISHQKLDTRLYKAAMFAYANGLIAPGDNGNMRWDEPISKSEAIQLMYNTEIAKNRIYGYQTTNEYGKNNPKNFGIASIEMIDGQLILNPKTDEQGNIYGLAPSGEVVTKESKEFIDAQKVFSNS